jgi:hypothetical protein
MALNRYVVTATTTVPAGTLATVTPGESATGGGAGYGSSATTGGPLFATTFLRGTPLVLDTGSALNVAGALRAFTDGQDTVGHAAIGN